MEWEGRDGKGGEGRKRGKRKEEWRPAHFLFANAAYVQGCNNQ